MKKNISVWLLLFATTLLLRSYSFFFSVIDWDESLYLLIAEAWSHGSIPYVEIWDQKPPGIYFCFLIAKLAGFGDILLGIRLLSVVVVATSAFLLYKIPDTIVPVKSYLVYVPACLYIVFSLNNQGLAANTEIFFTPFVLGGFYCIVRCLNRDKTFTINPRLLLLSGFLFGIAFQIKYLTAFDLIALTTGIVLLQWATLKKKAFLSIAKIGALMVGGFILPNLVVVIYFQYHHHLQDLVDATLSANVQHRTHGDFSFTKTAGKFYLQFRDQLLLWGSVFLALALFARGYFKDEKKYMIIFLLGWLVLDLVSISLTKKFYPHYFLQALPPLCLIFYVTVADFFETLEGRVRNIITALLAILLAVATVLPVVEDTVLTFYFRKIVGNPYWGDPSAEIATYIKTDISPDDYIFVAGGQPIIYYLTTAKIPTRFPYPPFLLDEHFRHVSGIDPDQEVRNIMSKKPKFVVTRKLKDNPFYQSLEPFLINEYNEVKDVEGRSIFLRKQE